MLVEIAGGVAVVTLNRPSALNALDTQALDDLLETFAELDGDDAVRAVVLTGAGERAFAAGADIREMRDKTPVEAVRFAELGHEVCDTIARLSKPVIAAVDGFALGGGCELALACDFIVAAEHATFGQPEVKLGILPGWGGTQRLARRVGEAWAKRLITTGEPIDAATALRIGLVTEVVAAGTAREAALAVARQIRDRAPIAVALAKQAVNAGLGGDAAPAFERHAFGVCFSTEDRREGMAAFVEKRAPTFIGR